MTSLATIDDPMDPTEDETVDESRRTLFIVIFGIVLPVACLWLDPIVFTDRGFIRSRPGFLSHLAPLAWTCTGLFITTLSVQLAFRPRSRVVAGVLATGALFALVVQVLILPLALIGSLMLIGLMGFIPFFTCRAYWLAARRCLEDIRADPPPTDRAAYAVGPAAMALLVVLQLAALRVAEASYRDLLHPDPATRRVAIDRLVTLRRVFDRRRIVTAFNRTPDPLKQQRLVEAYAELTGINLFDEQAKEEARRAMQAEWARIND